MTTDIQINFFTDEEGQKAFSFGTATPEGVTGLYKLLNQWLKALFTDLGSDPTAKEDGSNFAQLIGANVGLVDELFEVITISLDQATSTIERNQRSQDLPPEEIFGGVTLQSIEEDGPDGIVVSVVLENAAGQSLLVRTSLGEGA